MSKTFFTEEQQQQILEAIRKAELNTSGEIRLHLEGKCEQEPVDRAKELFEQLGMTATKEKNGVLIYVAYMDHKLAILGDSGIHAKVSQEFWDEEKDLLLTYFKQDKHAEGLVLAIAKAGEKLKLHFPYQADDKDELTNDISFGDGGDRA